MKAASSFRLSLIALVAVAMSISISACGSEIESVNGAEAPPQPAVEDPAMDEEAEAEANDLPEQEFPVQEVKSGASSSGSAGTQSYPLVQEGQDLAQLWCNACHVTGSGRTDSGMDAAPSFQGLAPLVAENPDRYRTFLTQPHVDAMRAISLSRREIDALVAYIASKDE
jgi:mono/diheme cytochrome c family protein